jgi:maltose O-acetyltransferase
LGREKEKMLAGEYYDPSDLELVQDRELARNLLLDYNSTKPQEKDKRGKILKQLLNSRGSCYIEPPFYCDYGYNIHLGADFYANFGCVILDVNQVIMGDHVLVGPYVQIYTATHPTDPEKRLTGQELAKRIIIGNNVWIGGGAIICPGVTIGDNVTIGAGSVITKDIPDQVLVVGNPGRIIGKMEKGV